MNLFTKSIVMSLAGPGEQSSLKAQMIRGAMGTVVLKIVNMVLGFGTSLFLARALGAKEYGVYAYALSWALLLAVPPLVGLNILLVREVARYKALGDWGALKGFLRWSDRLVLLTSVVVALGFALAVCFLRRRFVLEVRIALWSAATLIPPLSFLLLRQGALRGLGHVVEAQIPQMFVLPFLFLLGAGALYLLHLLSGVVAVWAWLGASLVALFLSLFLLWKYLPKRVRGALPVYSQREWLHSAFPLFLVGIANIVNQRISAIMVGSIIGPKAVGIFDVAMRGAAFVSFALLAVNMPLAPAIARLHALGDKERLQRLVTRGARVALLGALPVAFGMIFFGRWLLLIFGQEFTSATTVLAILSTGQLVNVSMGSVAYLLNMTGHEKDTVVGVGAAALVNIVLNAWLTPLWGVNGAAAANAISMMTWNILLSWMVYKRIGIYSTALGVFPRRAS